MSPLPGSRRGWPAAACLCAAVLCASFVIRGECQTTTPQTPCSAYKNCDKCAPNAKCLWCFTTNNCTEYPVSWLLPPPSVCPLAQARWGACWLNFEYLIITFGVLGGVLLLSLVVCCCCCCCKRRSSRPDRAEEGFVRRREEIKQRAEERNVERKTRHDQIRKKYGLMTDSDHPYSKFENE